MSSATTPRLLDGRVVLVAGVGPGLGRAIALACAEQGAALVLGARTVDCVESVAGDVRDAGHLATAVRLDITDPGSCAAAVDAAVAEHGRVDVLVNNALAYGERKPVLDGDLEVWRRVMEVNLFGSLQMTRAVVPVMRHQGEGRVVMVNTMAVRRIRSGAGAYASSKSALETATRTLAVELGADGIRVNSVLPGYTWTPSLERWLAMAADQQGVTPEDLRREVVDETCLRRIPSAEEVAGSVVFFASDLSRPITGQSLGANAGHWLY